MSRAHLLRPRRAGQRRQVQLVQDFRLALLRGAFDQGKLSFHGELSALVDTSEFKRGLSLAAETEWVVYAKPPFGGPDQVLKYLAR